MLLMRKTIALYVIGLIFACLVAPAQSERVRIDGVAAHVNESIITVSQVMAMVRPVQRQLANTYSGDELDVKLRKAYGDALDSLIGRQVILDEYARSEARLPEWVIDNRVDEIIRETFGGDKIAMMAALSKDSITFEEWRTQIHDHMVVASMRREHVDRHIRISPKHARSVYESNQSKYRLPAQVKLRMIAMKKASTDNATEQKRQEIVGVLKRLKAGEDFAVLARAKSEGVRTADGGDWGWIEPSTVLSLDLSGAVKKLATGEISDVVETAQEFYILKIEGRKSEATAAFKDVRQQIERELRLTESETVYKAWIQGLRARSYVNVPVSK